MRQAKIQATEQKLAGDRPRTCIEIKPAAHQSAPHLGGRAARPDRPIRRGLNRHAPKGARTVLYRQTPAHPMRLGLFKQEQAV